VLNEICQIKLLIKTIDEKIEFGFTETNAQMVNFREELKVMKWLIRRKFEAGTDRSFI